MSEINLCHTTKIKRGNKRIGKKSKNEGINRRKVGCSVMNNFELITLGNIWAWRVGAWHVAAFPVVIKPEIQRQRHFWIR
jgi:hypothetical protein